MLSASPTYTAGFPDSESIPLKKYTPGFAASSRARTPSSSLRGPAMAFPVQFESSAVRRRFGSPWTRKSFMVALGIGESRLGTLVRNVRLNHENSFSYFSDSIFSNSALLAVVGFEPIGKLLSAFARIARNAASGNVFAINYSRVIYDVFPCRYRLPGLVG